MSSQLALLEMKSTGVEIKKKKCDKLVDSIQPERISELQQKIVLRTAPTMWHRKAFFKRKGQIDN